ncbi:hypothetical protein [Prolixibacter sp. SD074]|uniref:hypothetical protein n=1 Tax=Prolixibacter sp. SD074 TaxID=2652391 RepID=UPI00129904FC|nr:hypothetical protein [Prolixibacter sp. SD074]
MRGFCKILVVMVLVYLFASCEKENINSSNDALLHFSTDTVAFDTIFTAIGSPTRNVRVVNPTNSTLVISSIKLAGGNKSGFRLNVNGEVANDVYDVEVPPNDSIFVFVEVTLGENGGNIPMVAEDSIVFRVNGIMQDVNLIAWGQDFKRINSKVIETTTWTNEKPYLVYNYAYVDSGAALTIEPGTIIYFHDGAGFYVKGTLDVQGTNDEPVVFQGDRLESIYSDLPDQWNGIILFSGSHNNRLEHAVIKNANIGLQVGTIEHEGYASVELADTRIENMSWAGIWAMKSKILASNCVISNVRYYNTALLLGGDYQFYHSTFANYYNALSTGIRNTETLIVSNYLIDSKTDTRYVGNMTQATFGNCIVTGNRSGELLVRMDKKGEGNYLFDNCLLQLSDTIDIDNNSHYLGILRNADPRFIDPYKGNFQLDTLSTVKDIGKLSYAKMFPNDFLGESRLDDAGPDLGAYERIEKDPDKNADSK